MNPTATPSRSAPPILGNVYRHAAAVVPAQSDERAASAGRRPREPAAAAQMRRALHAEPTLGRSGSRAQSTRRPPRRPPSDHRESDRHTDQRRQSARAKRSAGLCDHEWYDRQYAGTQHCERATEKGEEQKKHGGVWSASPRRPVAGIARRDLWSVRTALSASVVRQSYGGDDLPCRHRLRIADIRPPRPAGPQRRRMRASRPPLSRAPPHIHPGNGGEHAHLTRSHERRAQFADRDSVARVCWKR